MNELPNDDGEFLSVASRLKVTVLHNMCQFLPPLDVIKMLLKAYPNAIFEIDYEERHGFHIPCKHGCIPGVVKYLLKKNPEWTPLLLACKNFVFESCVS